jgi:uncharacterized protein YcbX
MKLQQIWRYPVKSMGGEKIPEAPIGAEGIFGDRLVQVYDPRGGVVTARRYPRLLRHHASLGADGEPLVDGRRWNSPEVAREVEKDVGPGARLVRGELEARFDILPLLVATDGTLAAFGYDFRRLRPNLIIEGVEGLLERSWEGRRLQIGEAIIFLDDLRGRCVMTTFDPDTNVQDHGVLRSIVERFEGRLCLNARVDKPGRIREGDEVAILPG